MLPRCTDGDEFRFQGVAESRLTRVVSSTISLEGGFSIPSSILKRSQPSCALHPRRTFSCFLFSYNHQAATETLGSSFVTEVTGRSTGLDDE
jgi:hypothetical protein